MAGFAPAPPPGAFVPGGGQRAAVRNVGPSVPSLLPGVFSVEHIDLISKLTASQFAVCTKDDVTWMKKPYWVSYFWIEAKKHPQKWPAHAQEIVNFFNAVVVLPATWDPGQQNNLKLNGSKLTGPNVANTALQLKPDPWGATNDVVLRALLEALLDMGFTAFQPAGVDQKFGLSNFDPSIDMARRSALIGKDSTYFLGWRGDGRDFKTIAETTKGMYNKCDSEGYAKSHNLREAWNPFSSPQYRNSWYFREGSQDNCLMTLVSVSTDFKSSATFPLIDELFLTTQTTTNALPSSDKEILPAFKKNWYRVNDAAGNSTIRYADRQQLYLVIVDRQVFDTQHAQGDDPFPEVAVKGIPETGMFACISFIRVVHGMSTEEGLTILFDMFKTIDPNPVGCLRHAANRKKSDELYAHVKKLFAATVEEINKGMSVRWAPNGALGIDPLKIAGKPAKIASITTLDNKPFWKG